MPASGLGCLIHSAAGTRDGDVGAEEGHERFVNSKVVLVPLLDLVLREGKPIHIFATLGPGRVL